MEDIRFNHSLYLNYWHEVQMMPNFWNFVVLCALSASNDFDMNSLLLAFNCLCDVLILLGKHATVEHLANWRNGQNSNALGTCCYVAGYFLPPEELNGLFACKYSVSYVGPALVKGQMIYAPFFFLLRVFLFWLFSQNNLAWHNSSLWFLRFKITRRNYHFGISVKNYRQIEETTISSGGVDLTKVPSI